MYGNNVISTGHWHKNSCYFAIKLNLSILTEYEAPNIFAKCFFLDFWQGSESVSEFKVKSER